jgi:AcrR family transcriptional regulator
VSADALTREQILRAAEDVLRRFGPGKATVVDVARALGVSHGSVYRHFASKTALREAVTVTWLQRVHEPLESIPAGPAAQRLRQWMTTLVHQKRARALADPELFATYMVLVHESSTAVDDHVSTLVGDLTAIIAVGVAEGSFHVPDAEVAARAVWDATSLFHNPAHAAGWNSPTVEAEFQAVLDLALRGLA